MQSNERKENKITGARGSLVLFAILAAGFWGFSFIASDIMLDTFEPIQVLSLRWTLAAIFFLILAAAGVVDVSLKGKEKKWIILTLLAQPCFYYIFETYGVKTTNASMSSIFIATIPSMTLILGILLFHRRPTGRGILGILLAFVGVTICTVGAPDFAAEGKIIGYLILLITVFFGGIYCHFSANAGQFHAALTITAWMAFTGAVWFTLLNFVMGYGIGTYTVAFTDWRLIAGILFLGIGCSAIGFFGYNVVLQRAKDPAVAGNVVSSMVTVIGVVAGVLLRGDTAGLYTVIGVAVTLVGVVISSQEA